MFKGLFAAIIGAIIAFCWYSASWMALPWHHWDFKSFKQGGEHISEAVKTETMDVGIYVVPNMSEDFNKNYDAQKTWESKATAGPFVYLVVNPKGKQWDMKTALGLELGVAFVAALVLMILLKSVGINGAWKSAFFCSFAVLIGTFLANAGYFIWWGFPLMSTLINLADAWIAWFISGLFMGLIAKR